MLRFLVILIGIAGAIVAAIWITYYLVFVIEGPEETRTKALRTVARSRSLRFNAINDFKHRSTYRAFNIFPTSGHCINTMDGYCKIKGKPHRIKMGDFEYTVSSDDGSTTYRFSYLCVHLPYTDVPELSIRNEKFMDKIKASVGFEDIDFESAHFSRKYYVQSPDKKFAYSVITPLMMEDSLRYPLPEINMKDGIICVSDGRTRWQPHEFFPRLDPVADFLNLWPEHVIRSLQERVI